MDLKYPEFAPTSADEFVLIDLREKHNREAALFINEGRFDEVYQLAADMGGMGFIHSAECDIMHNSALINIYMTRAAAEKGIPRYFYSSSVCVYRDMRVEPEMTEAEAIPANPDNEYGWEKLYSERMALAYERRYGVPEYASPVFRTAMAPKVPGKEDARRRRLRSAARWPKLQTAAQSKSGEMALRSVPIPTSKTW